MGRHFDGTAGPPDTCVTNASVAHGVGTGDWTLTGWLRIPSISGSDKGIWGSGVSANPLLYIEAVTGKLGISWLGNGGHFNTPLTPNVWTEVLIERRAGIVSCYLNNVAEATTYDFTGEVFSNGVQRFGNAGGDPFTGDLAYWSFAPFALSSGQIQSLQSFNQNPYQVVGGESHWPFSGWHTPERDLINGYNLTLTGTTMSSTEPPCDPLFTQIEIQNPGASGKGELRYQTSWLVRTSDAVLWAAYVNSSSGISAKFSLDNGATWSVAEVVFTPSHPLDVTNWPVSMTRDVDNQPVIFAETKDDAGIKIRVFRRESGVWVAKGIISPVTDGGGTLFHSFKFKLYQHPDTPSKWLFIGADFGGVASVSRVFYAISSNDLTSWAAKVTVKDANHTDLYLRGAADFAMSASSDLVTGVMAWIGGGAERVSDVEITGWDGSPSVVVTDNVFGPYSSGQPVLSFSVALYANDDLRISYSEYFNGAQNFELKTRLKSSGTWGAADASGYITSGQIPDTQLLIDESDDFWIYSDATGIGAHTGPNVKLHYKKRNIWQSYEPVDDADIHGTVSLLTQSHLIGSQQSQGWFIGYLDATDSKVVLLTSADLLFPSAVTTPVPTTPAPTTPAPTTGIVTTPVPTTSVPTTPGPTTPTPTTIDPTITPMIACGRTYVPARRELLVRAWLETVDEFVMLETPLSQGNSRVTLYDEAGTAVGSVPAEFDDPAGAHVLQFRIPQVVLRPGHAYILRVAIMDEDDVTYGFSDFAMGTT